MKVVDRKAFLALPEGTIYCKGVQWDFHSLCVKGETWGSDWTYWCPEWIDANDSSEAMNRLDEMLATGASYPMDDAYGRDGCFEEDAVFLIFEPDDLRRLSKFIMEAIQL